MKIETTFTMETSRIKFGAGATAELGYDLQQRDVRRVLVLTDPNLAESQAVQTALHALRTTNIEAVLFDRVQIEPTDSSFLDAIQAAVAGNFDGFVAVGGGSVIDTAKVANLYATYPADLLTYVNPPLGAGMKVPGPLKPLIAVPTTAGTGSETTGVAIFDYEAMHVKTGISHPALRPVLGIVDPENTRTMPPLVTACTGLDVLSHALESWTAIPFDQRPAPNTPAERPPYQGSNPISNIWAAKAVELVSANLLRAIENPDDTEARGNMMLAAAYAGIGFGNAGVHLPHAMSYPVSGMVRDFRPADYHVDRPIVPHGMSVILNTPAVFRFTAAVDPERHLAAARLMGADTSTVAPADAGEFLAAAVIRLMQATGMPNGLQAVGFTAKDVDKLVEGTLAQQRLTKLSPRPANEADLKALFLDALSYW